MSRFALVVAAAVALAVGPGLVVGAEAQKLEVEPGLWEYRIGDAEKASQVCYTAEVLQGGLGQFALPPGLECSFEVKEATAKRVVTHAVCHGSIAMEGITTIEILDRKAMSMVSDSTVTFGGQQQKIEAKSSFKWLAADCGDVAPFDPKNPTRG
jgi:hypothetical protein